MRLDAHHFTKSEKTGVLSCEASQLRIGRPPRLLTLDGHMGLPDPIQFEFTHADKDASGEDIYGWNYRSRCGMKLLIIND